MVIRMTLQQPAEHLTDALFCQEEPWRSRFLALVAHYADGQAEDGRLPTREEVTAWLGRKPHLCSWVAQLLMTWYSAQVRDMVDSSVPLQCFLQANSDPG